MRSQLPHGLCVVWEEGGLRAQQPFVPRERRRVVGDWNSREQVEIRSRNHSSCSFLFTNRSYMETEMTRPVASKWPKSSRQKNGLKPADGVGYAFFVESRTSR